MYIVHLFEIPQVCSAAGVSGSVTGVANPMIQLFQRLYGTRIAPNIIKYNDFTDVGAYYLLKVRICIAMYVHLCHNDIIIITSHFQRIFLKFWITIQMKPDLNL